MSAVLHRIEALPGQGRYAVTFRRPDGAEQAAVAQVGDSGVTVAESSLPSGWTTGSDAAQATFAAVAAVHEARRAAVGDTATLRDVEGGWDVGLGNIVLGKAGIPACTAHGDLIADGDVWTCPECGARAVFS